jgi:hypothetical protein
VCTVTSELWVTSHKIHNASSQQGPQSGGRWGGHAQAHQRDTRPGSTGRSAQPRQSSSFPRVSHSSCAALPFVVGRPPTRVPHPSALRPLRASLTRRATRTNATDEEAEAEEEDGKSVCRTHVCYSCNRRTSPALLQTSCRASDSTLEDQQPNATGHGKRTRVECKEIALFSPRVLVSPSRSFFPSSCPSPLCG